MLVTAKLSGVGAVGLVLSVGLCSADSSKPQPGIVLVLTDDQGYGDLSCHGNQRLQTPHLDRLYLESVRLTDYHVSPTCTPTRAALLTGRYSNRTGAWHTINGRSIIRENERTVAQMLQENGYRTALFGKWHLGDNYPSRPQDKGFEEVYCHGGGGMGQTPDFWDNTYFNATCLHNGIPKSFEGFCTDVFFDRAMKFIEGTSDQPFFVYLSLNAAHTPLHCPESFSAPYADLGERMANFYGMISNIDWNMGRLNRFLEEKGLAENTILIFTTDNGSSFGWKRYNAGMRGGKGSPYDGGHRVPFFIRWPSGGLLGGRDVDDLAAHIDVLPTLMDLIGLSADDGLPKDGESLAPVLRGTEAKLQERAVVVDSQRQYLPEKWRSSSVMTKQWRLVNGQELYDIQKDSAQAMDRSTDFPETVALLRSAYDMWWNSMKDSFDEECEIVLGDDHDNPARLTAHDWMLKEENAPWNQKLIRQLGAASEGDWAVRIAEAGLYRIRIFRWPPEAGYPIAADMPQGKDVPGEAAYRIEPGRGFAAVKACVDVAGKRVDSDVAPTDCYVEFTLQLPATETRLRGTFFDSVGARQGSYYAVVERL